MAKGPGATKKEIAKFNERHNRESHGGHLFEKAGQITSANKTYNLDGSLKSGGSAAAIAPTVSLTGDTSNTSFGAGRGRPGFIGRGGRGGRTGPGGRFQQVKSTDSIGSIASSAGINRKDLIDANPSNGTFSTGTSVRVPDADPLSTVERVVQGGSVQGGAVQAPQQTGSTAALTGDISQGAGQNTAGFRDEGGAINGILNQLEATGSFYDSAGNLKTVQGYKSVHDKMMEAQTLATQTGRDPSDFLSFMPATIPPQVAAMVMDFDASDPNSLNNEMALFGYGFNRDTQLWEQGTPNPSASSTSGGVSRGGRSGGGGGGARNQKPISRTSSVNPMSWRIATG